MDQYEKQNISTLIQNLKAHYYLVKLTQVLVSVSVCSLIYSPSSFLVFLHYFKFYFSTFPFQLYTHNIDKNCMFLLCNGLLVFVGITKSLTRSSCDDGDKPSSYVKDASQSQFSVINTNELMLEIVEKELKINELDEENIAAEQVIEIENCAEEEVEENIEKIILVDEGEGKGSSLVLKEEEIDEESELLDVCDEEEEEEEEKESETDYILIEESIQEEEENVEEESFMLSTEELNKKVEDFIRKMKQDLRIEAQRQLVMV